MHCTRFAFLFFSLISKWLADLLKVWQLFDGRERERGGWGGEALDTLGCALSTFHVRWERQSKASGKKGE
jgi:hypothetical protein